MITFKHTIPFAALSLIMVAACATDSTDLSDQETFGANDVASQPLEQKLNLIPQILKAADIPEEGGTLSGTSPRYVILSTESGAIDIDAIAVSSEEGDSRSVSELFGLPPSARTVLSERDALLLLAAPEEDVKELCDRFQFAHDDVERVTVEGEQLMFLAPAKDGRAHALCLLPESKDANDLKNAGQDTTADLAAPSDTQDYGSGSYTVRVKTLKCNDPRDWENWPYNGDEARLRGFYNGYGGDQIWSSNNVESGDSFSPNRYIHFSSSAKLELYDYDSALWNASDKLGAVSIYGSSACKGDQRGDFDGSGSGHNWNYDLTYRVYGPSCPCQSQEPAIYTYSQSEACSITSSTITSYSYYCSGGIYWRQAYGNITKHCTTTQYKYNESCEMKTFVSSTVLSECDKYQPGVAIGSPTQVGTCDLDPCDPYPQGKTSDQTAEILPPTCAQDAPTEM